MWRMTRSIAVFPAATSATALSIDENMVNSLMGTTTVPLTREKCSTTPSCARAASDTQSRSRSRGSR